MLRWSRPPTSPNDLMDAILENRRLILDMSDALATALADLNTAVSTLQSKIEAATADISSLTQQLLNAAGAGATQEMADAAAQIEARVGDINAASTALGDAVATPSAPAPATEEPVEPTPAPAEPIAPDAPVSEDPAIDPTA